MELWDVRATLVFNTGDILLNHSKSSYNFYDDDEEEDGEEEDDDGGDDDHDDNDDDCYNLLVLLLAGAMFSERKTETVTERQQDRDRYIR